MTNITRCKKVHNEFIKWLGEVVLSFYKKNIKNPEIIGKELVFSVNDGLNLSPDETNQLESEFSDWLEDEICKEQLKLPVEVWAEGYEDVSLEALDVNLRDEDFDNLEDWGYKDGFLDRGCICILKVIVPKCEIREKEVLVRFEANFVLVIFNEPYYSKYNRMDDPFADHGSYEWEFIEEKYYNRIKEALDELGYLGKNYEDRYFKYSEWETPCFDDPEITKEHVTEETIDINNDDYNDDDDDDDYDDNDCANEEIRDTIQGWYLFGAVDEKCSKIYKNLKYLEEDEVFKLTIIGNEDFVLDEETLGALVDGLRDDWWDYNEANELGEKNFDEETTIEKCLDSPELEYEYDKENRIITVRAKFSVYYASTGACWALDSDEAEACYESGESPSDLFDDDDYGTTPREWWEDDYGSEDAFWECNGI